jgi:Ulp1 family protease
VRGNHWALAHIQPNHSEHSPHVVIYDSLQVAIGDPNTEHIVLLRGMVDISRITFDTAKVQQQLDASSCGLFCIAFAVDIAHNKDPRHSTYDVKKMRQHLFECLNKKKLTPFL